MLAVHSATALPPVPVPVRYPVAQLLRVELFADSLGTLVCLDRVVERVVLGSVSVSVGPAMLRSLEKVGSVQVVDFVGVTPDSRVTEKDLGKVVVKVSVGRDTVADRSLLRS